MNRINDHAQRQRALNVEESFIIQAPAGSGKTELLIQRFLRLLSVVDEPEEIIAMTFTRKAASEMRQRIIQALENVELGEVPESDHAKLTFELASAALKRAKEKKWRLLSYASRLRIQTIDAFSSGLSRQMPVLSGLGAQPETLEDASQLYEQAATNTLLELEANSQWSQQVAKLLQHLDNDMSMAKRLIVNMLRKRDQWLPHIVGIQSSEQNERQVLEASMQALIQESLNKLISLFSEGQKNELFMLLKFAAKNILEEKPSSPIAKLSELEVLPDSKVISLDNWKIISDLLLTTKGEWRQKPNKNNGFPAVDKNAEDNDLRKEMKQRIIGLIQEFSQVEGLLEALVFIKQLPEGSYSDEQWGKINILSRILILAEAQLRVLFANNNQIDFSGIAQSASKALGDTENPTDLALKLDYNIQHLLVDEFQDISVSQKNLLGKIVKNWISDDGHSLFLVGDPMQSIYRFREAEVGVFIKAFIEEQLEQFPLTALRLNMNFRSTKTLVEYFNQSFKTIFPKRDDVTKGAVTYSESQAVNEGEEDAINYYPQYVSDRDKEAEHVITAIENIKQANSEDSVAILVRSRKHLQSIVPLLKDRNIQFQALDIDSLAHKAIIQDLLALTLAYLYPADRISWYTILRAPWCGIELNDLQRLVKQDNQATIFSLMQDENRLNSLSLEGRARLEKINVLFTQAYKTQHRKSLRNTIASLWYDLSAPACYENTNDIENAKAFFSLLSKHEQAGNLVDRQQFNKALNQLFDKTVVENAKQQVVQIMTIHKAKGLEFDHVFLLGLGYKARPQQAELLLWRQVAPSNTSNSLLLAPIRQVGENKSSIYSYLEYLEKESQSLEQERLLYVAMTRAKQSLHLFGHCNESINKKSGEIELKPTANSHLEKLWPIVEDHYLEKHLPTNEDNNAKVLLVNNKNYRLPLAWQAPKHENLLLHLSKHTETMSEEAALIEYEWAGETIRQIGSVTHEIIQYISDTNQSNLSSDDIEAWKPLFKTELLQRGVKDSELDWASGLITQALANMLNDKKGQWILSSEHKDAQNEYALTGVFENKVTNIIIDRTFVDKNGVRWIIDYKTSRHEEDDKESFLDQQQERYKEQLEKYAVIMQGLEDKSIHLGLYFPLLNGWREWEFN